MRLTKSYSSESCDLFRKKVLHFCAKKSKLFIHFSNFYIGSRCSFHATRYSRQFLEYFSQTTWALPHGVLECTMHSAHSAPSPVTEYSGGIFLSRSSCHVSIYSVSHTVDMRYKPIHVIYRTVDIYFAFVGKSLKNWCYFHAVVE